MDSLELDSNAKAMVAPGKGILAADESTGTIKKRFDKIGLESTFESRRAYRELLFTEPDAERHISGVILYDETIRQKAADGRPFPALLAARGILPGIKVYAGAKPLAGFPGETVTEGLDGLRERLAEYRGLGARCYRRLRRKWGSIEYCNSARTLKGIKGRASHKQARSQEYAPWQSEHVERRTLRA